MAGFSAHQTCYAFLLRKEQDISFQISCSLYETESQTLQIVVGYSFHTRQAESRSYIPKLFYPLCHIDKYGAKIMAATASCPTRAQRTRKAMNIGFNFEPHTGWGSFFYLTFSLVDAAAFYIDILLFIMYNLGRYTHTPICIRRTPCFP